MRKRFLVIVLGALLLPGAAMAINFFAVRDLPIRYMTDEDQKILRTAATSALERSRDGISTSWENPKTGAHGDLTPVASYDRDGRPCRDLEVANSARGRSNRMVVTLCKQAGGEWKIESQ